MKRTLVIDGSYLLKQSYTALKGDYGSEVKKRTTFVFMTTLRKVIKQLMPNKIVVAWDGENSGYQRFELYKNYKANREMKSWYSKTVLSEAQKNRIEKEKTDFIFHKTNIKNYLEELFIRQIEIDLIEADDIISYYCKMLHKEEYITILTKDRDLVQLLKYDNVNIILGDKKVNVTNENNYVDSQYIIINKHNYHNHLIDMPHYENIALVKTFSGDSSDNISGISRLTIDKICKVYPKVKRAKVTIEELDKFLNEYSFTALDEIYIKNKISNDMVDLLSKMSFIFDNGRFYVYIENMGKHKICDAENEKDAIYTFIELYKHFGRDNCFIYEIFKFLKEERKIVYGNDLIVLNDKLVNLDYSDVYLSEEQKDFILMKVLSPLEYENEKGEAIRGGKFLLDYMKKDKFLEHQYTELKQGNQQLYTTRFIEYTTPFMHHIKNEKEYYKSIVKS